MHIYTVSSKAQCSSHGLIHLFKKAVLSMLQSGTFPQISPAYDVVNRTEFQLNSIESNN